MSEYNVSNYAEQDGDRKVIGGSLDVVSGGEIDIESGGALKVAGTDVTSEVGALSGVTATASELNLLDVSAQSETITEAGAVSVVKRNTEIDSSGGAYAITLAAPDASMLGQVKVIEMTTAGNAVTMALTNVQGGSAATSASFDAVNETLILVAGTNKWNVVGEIGVTLS